MSEEEKQAIKRLDYIIDFIIENGQYNADVEDKRQFVSVLNLIDKQQKQIKNAKEILEDYQNSLYTIEDRKSMSDSHIEMAIYYLGGKINE